MTSKFCEPMSTRNEPAAGDIRDGSGFSSVLNSRGRFLPETPKTLGVWRPVCLSQDKRDGKFVSVSTPVSTAEHNKSRDIGDLANYFSTASSKTPNY